MSEFVPRAEAVEKAAQVAAHHYWSRHNPPIAIQVSTESIWLGVAKDAIAAFCEEEGLTVETRFRVHDTKNGGREPERRLVGSWIPEEEQ